MDNSFDLPPLPWPDIEAWLEVSSAEEIAAGIRAYARAAIEAEREAEREACENLCDNHQKMCKATGYPREAAVARKLAEMIQQRGKS